MHRGNLAQKCLQFMFQLTQSMVMGNKWFCPKPPSLLSRKADVEAQVGFPMGEQPNDKKKMGGRGFGIQDQFWL